MEILDKIFGSVGKVRMMRLFLHNATGQFSLDDIEHRTLLTAKEVKNEITNLEKIGLVKRRKISRKETPESTRSKKVLVWVLNPKFTYLNELRNFLINAAIVQNSDLVKRLSRVGKLKLIIIAGVFINQADEGQVDLLVVGDSIRRASFENIIRNLEAEVGKELKYAVFETPDFVYRLNMYDKLIRDILDYDHQVILERISLKRP